MGGGRGGFTAEGAESAEGEEGLALTPVSSTGQALGLSQDGSPHPRIEHGAGSSPLPGRERGWEAVAKKGGKCCITLHFVAFPLVIVKL